MTTTTIEHGGTLEPEGDGHGVVEGGGHHETRAQRHLKERIALWLLVGGDALFLLLELFTWFYLRALNTNGMWRGAACTKANACTDGLGNPITSEIPKAGITYTLVIAALTVVAALLVWWAEVSAQRQSPRRIISAGAGFALLTVLVAVVVQCYQFGQLPFTTIDGAYASSFIFFMGTTLAHLGLLVFILTGLWVRARRGKYDGGHWFQVGIIRFFTAWCAIVTCVLAATVILFA
ncbi:MAG: hypothetical protein ABSB68_15360 [Acidimicrobiales bacterium]|jgi:heme/copper-type cytochrome/quinol oxidase subunit 3